MVAIRVFVWAACGLAGANWAANAQTQPKTTTAAPAHQRETPKAPARNAQPSRSDAQIEALIRAKLAKSAKLSADRFQVRVQGGVATLEGKTDIVQHKGTATRMAKTAGAVAVNNHIQISDAAKAKAAGNLETGRRRAQVKRGDARSQTTPPRGGGQ